MPPRDKDGNYAEVEPMTIMIRNSETGEVFEFSEMKLDEDFTPRRGLDDGFISPCTGIKDDGFVKPSTGIKDDGFVKPSTGIKDDGFVKPSTEPEAVLTIRPTRMSRKRFIKLLMSQHYSRNEARAWAEAARNEQITYSTAYIIIRIQEGLIPCQTTGAEMLKD